MSVATYNRIAARGADLIERFGRPVEIVTTVTTGGDSFDPDSGTTTETAVPVTVVETKASAREVEGDTVPEHDRVYLVPAGVDVPSDAVIRESDGREFSVIDVEPLRPGSVDVYARVFCAR